MSTVWLASYPKSGSTWFRVLLDNLATQDGQPVDINTIRGSIASARLPFDRLLLLDSGILTHEEVDCLRTRVYEEQARGTDHDARVGPVQFVKVHDAYTLTRQGEPLLAGARGAQGAIVIVRDPRDVVPSLANHNGTKIDWVISSLNDDHHAICDKPDRQDVQLRQYLGSWSRHVATWLDQQDIPVHLVRYEDLVSETARTLETALAFAGLKATGEAIARAVRWSDFAELQKQEKSKGFRESPARLRSNGSFFRRGEPGAWRRELTSEQVTRIEFAHEKMMKRLGYELSRAEEEQTE